MRLRSSQFVLLLLIACSVQIREECALRWVEQTVFGGSVRALVSREVKTQAGHFDSLSKPRHRLASFDLPPAAVAAQRVPWVMRRPASDFTAVAIYTGLLRV